jgi:histidinol-phosphate aminotransferase
VSWVSDIARADIRSLKPYQHALWAPGLIRLHANELPWRQADDPTEAGLNRYPEPHPHGLMKRLAALYHVPEACLLAGRGSDEAIDLLTRTYLRAGHDAMIITPPTFGMYTVAGRVQGAEIIEVPLRREAAYRLDVDALLGAVTPQTKLVFLCSPNNPTGTLIASDLVLQLVHALAGRALVVVDEAYIEFAGVPSLASTAASMPGLVVLRTLSKAHGLAGARCGVLIAVSEIVELIARVIMPYAIAQPSIEAALKALEPEPLARSRIEVATLLAERERLQHLLAYSRGALKVWPSAANFLLVEFADPASVIQRAHGAGFLLRDLSHVPGLHQAVRISLGTPEQNDRLLASLA